MPIIEYRAYIASMKAVVPCSVSLIEEATSECPVSEITSKSAELVFKYHRARGQGKTLGQMLKSNEAWIEDAEETLDRARLTAKYEVEKDKQKRR